jgi:hypothetical protein
MDHYISQLISDILQATRRVMPPHKIWEDANPDDEGDLEDMP